MRSSIRQTKNRFVRRTSAAKALKSVFAYSWLRTTTRFDERVVGRKRGCFAQKETAAQIAPNGGLPHFGMLRSVSVTDSQCRCTGVTHSRSYDAEAQHHHCPSSRFWDSGGQAGHRDGAAVILKGPAVDSGRKSKRSSGGQRQIAVIDGAGGFIEEPEPENMGAGGSKGRC